MVPTGVAFAELVTPDVEPVTALLGALGFTRRARHRSKPVDLWQQGEARVLVNTGPAARRDGTSSPPSAWSPRTRQPRPGAPNPRPGPAPPPRSRGRTAGRGGRPDGTELFFCVTDRSGHPEPAGWTGDFVPVPHERLPQHVARIDHLALTQPWHQFDEAALFHRSVLGLSAQDSVDVADPYGLHRSRAVTNADGSVRIALGVGPAPSDEGARAQHIALATDDVVAAARRFREAGGRLLAMPANYYDDLAARYEFADGEPETYRELGILYDRDAEGEFRHCYTETVGRVFFELVQRDGGYRGYGAQNALCGWPRSTCRADRGADPRPRHGATRVTTPPVRAPGGAILPVS